MELHAIVIKNECVVCFEFIEGDPLKRYEKNGNFCSRCSRKAYANYRKKLRARLEDSMPKKYLEILRRSQIVQ